MRRVIWLVPLLVVLTAGCSNKEKEIARILESPIEYHSHKSPWADFTDYRTWSWVPVRHEEAVDPREADPAVREVIEAAISKQMEIRGYRATSVAPDIVLNYHVASREITSDYIAHMYDGRYYPEYRMDFAGPRSARRRWDEGSLIIFAFDTTTREMVWRSSAKAEITGDAPLEGRAKRLNLAVKNMFASLPGRPTWDR